MHVALLHTDSDYWAFGIRIISAVLKKEGHSTSIFIINGENGLYSKAVLEAVKVEVQNAGVIGISCLSRGSDNARAIIEYLKPLEKPMIWGGLHATLNYNECLEDVNIVCRGEGEHAILELVQKIQDGKVWQNIKNLAYRKNGNVFVNDLRPLVDNLDSLPYYDFSCDREYRISKDRLLCISNMGQLATNREIPFTGSRGCAFNCTYCCNSKIKELYSGKGRYIRKMSVKRYVDHCARMLEYFPRSQFRYFHLLDEDLFAWPKDHFREFCSLYKKKVGLPIQCMGSPTFAKEEKLKMLANAGLWRFHMGIESGSERTKKEIFNRNISNEAVLKAAKAIHDIPGIVSCFFLIIGNPYETNDDLIDSIRLLCKIHPGYFIRIYSLIFFPGSLLYERAINDGIIHGKHDSGYEMNFIGELGYQTHEWKRNNLYLNGVLFLMDGKCGRYFLGMIPRLLIPIIIHPKVIKFMDKYTILIKIIISYKMFLKRIRHIIGIILKYFFKDIRIIYKV